MHTHAQMPFHTHSDTHEHKERPTSASVSQAYNPPPRCRRINRADRITLHRRKAHSRGRPFLRPKLTQTVTTCYKAGLEVAAAAANCLQVRFCYCLSMDGGPPDLISQSNQALHWTGLMCSVCGPSQLSKRLQEKSYFLFWKLSFCSALIRLNPSLHRRARWVNCSVALSCESARSGWEGHPSKEDVSLWPAVLWERSPPATLIRVSRR